MSLFIFQYDQIDSDKSSLSHGEKRRLPEDEAQSEEPLFLGVREQKLAEEKLLGKGPSEMKLTVIIRNWTSYFE
ncbi:hypothetical protein [Salipaludibacillus agaradhaerens]|uniref:hypothetical protein n=1 Tax=Salipaludibacillus agaradhaerens TaxID=76935 RepID=UPI000998BAFD|nr:hypothetical protein [Salipaludibacillus agaradhaerens]